LSVKVADAVKAVTELSVAVSVKVCDPDVVGVPSITPVEVSRLRPAGSVPEVTDQV
jgi:hypothetical protein